MVEHRSGLASGIYLASIGVLGSAVVTGLLAEGRRGVSVAWGSALLLGLVTGWYFWPWLRRLRLRSPLHTPSPQASNPRVPIHRAPILDAERRRQLKALLIWLAQAGDQRATHPPYIQERWVGAATDLLEDAFGDDVAQTVLGFEGFSEKVQALRVLIRDIESVDLRLDFDPRDHDHMAV